MTRPACLRDSITRRFALAIATAAVVCIALNIMVDLVFGGPSLSPPGLSRLLDQLPGIVRGIDATAAPERDALAKAATTRFFSVDWEPSTGPPPPPAAPFALRLEPRGPAGANVLVADLHDGGALVFAPRLPGGMGLAMQWMLRIAILAFSILIVALLGASRLARPINAFAAAARRFGVDPNARPMPQQGPEEMRTAIAAFNTMQSQIQTFVAGQAAMFAAISHDLRTPLTRMRLRGEFIEDRAQQSRLFRDVDEMQTMVSAVLTFLRDNAADEPTTNLDLAELLQSIADDYADLGAEISYAGPAHVAFPGRPIGLRRAFGNLVDNAVKYGVRPTISVRSRGPALNVTITDHGPGIPDDALELVFAPFRRLEPSRNRNTGGMGLGLTAARACFRAHGGDVILSNARDGGLRAIVTLPLLSVDENESMRRGVPMFDDDPSDPIMLPSHAAGDRP